MMSNALKKNCIRNMFDSRFRNGDSNLTRIRHSENNFKMRTLFIWCCYSFMLLYIVEPVVAVDPNSTLFSGSNMDYPDEVDSESSVDYSVSYNSESIYNRPLGYVPNRASTSPEYKTHPVETASTFASSGMPDHDLDNVGANSRHELSPFLPKTVYPYNQPSSLRKRPKPTGMEYSTVFKTPKGTFKWPYREQVASIQGNITVGGLMMVHERDDKLICGKIMPQGGLQATEVMLYTVEQVNKMNLIPGVTLGARIKDDCDRDIYGLEQSVDFIRGSVTKLAGTTETCKGDEPQMIAGVIAAPSSVTSIQVANLLKLFKIPQVSFFSTSSALSSEQRFPFFMRTIPADKNQAEVMVNLVKLFNWTYVSVVYEESSYGQEGFEDVQAKLAMEGVCLAKTAKLIKDSGVANAKVYDDTVTTLLKAPEAKGVIVFGSDQEVAELMRAVDRANVSGYFTWIGSDGWGGRTLVSDGNELQVEGAVTVQPFAEPVKGFEEYFLNLRPETNTRNPWFREYWEDYFQCRVPGSIETPFNHNYSNICNGSEKQTKTNGYVAEAQLQFVSDAVMAFAVALKNMHEDYCGGLRNPGLCPEMDPYNGYELRDYLLNVNFTGLSGNDFHFLPNGDGPPRYRVLNFKQTEPGVFEWVTVGIYENSTLTVDMDKLQFTFNNTHHPESFCSLPCGFKEAQMFSTNEDKCCWNCIPCGKYQYLPTKFECISCPWGTLPSHDLKTCIAIPKEFLTYNSTIAIVAMSVAGLGIIVTTYVIYVFVKFCDTPVVKASGRELSFVLLAGIFICFGMTFVIIAPPTNIICGTQKFGVGFSFAVCYSALFTKTNRIARIFRAGKRTIKRPKFISPQSQLFICFSLVGIQVMISIIWLLLSPPQAGPYYPTRESNQLVCLSAVGLSYMIGFAYPIVLIIVCTIYAVLTRKIPEAFNESKYIGFTMYTTCIIWLAFVPIYFSTASNIELRLATLCLSISLSATVSLVCLFTPKMYIIILRPERNVRQSMMTSKLHSSMKQSTPNSSSLRVDSGTQSDGEMELHQRLKPSGSISSGFSRSTSATQTCSNGTSISTQTLDSIGREFDDFDVQL